MRERDEENEREREGDTEREIITTLANHWKHTVCISLICFKIKQKICVDFSFDLVQGNIN